ncbi:hypothetical protein LZ575_11170 [Antarcticibacterium sp. 1MA-6-2]|uniref:hypothetical protein n=1 Tax=Antarcticibacterium sp. 1MA-6-2 TaxID=2908210 RepID=UPI001F36BB13|nr:hypothetical protein [Antarcticibacterium sp. 1MA-6-2]UJH89649.1 hypothetical protein LZ575_11170 [Antarcticibacterium sp. 1MA-6-2]
MNQKIYRLKELLKEIWQDFKNTGSLTTGNKYCCSSNFFYPEDQLRPEPIRVNEQHNKHINLKYRQG